MAYKATTPSNKVTYFKHFPHFFIRPYDAQLQYNSQEFVEKLTPKNCEWLTRPKIAISEAAQGLRQNWDLIRESGVVSEETKNTLQNIMVPMEQALISLDTKEKNTMATELDVYNLLHGCFQNREIDGSLGAMMQESSALYVFLTQLRAMRSLISNPQQYATKLVSDSPEAVQFKNDKTVTSMQKMFTSLCISRSGVQPHSTNETNTLAAQLVIPGATVPIPSAPSTSGLQPPTAAPPVLIQATNPGINNQLLDTILQMQAQMQGMQQQLLQHQAPPTMPVTPEEGIVPAKKNKRKRQPVEPTTSTSTHPEEALETLPAAEEPTRKKKKVKKIQ